MGDFQVFQRRRVIFALVSLEGGCLMVWSFPTRVQWCRRVQGQRGSVYRKCSRRSGAGASPRKSLSWLAAAWIPVRAVSLLVFQVGAGSRFGGDFAVPCAECDSAKDALCSSTAVPAAPTQRSLAWLDIFVSILFLMYFMNLACYLSPGSIHIIKSWNSLVWKGP